MTIIKERKLSECDSSLIENNFKKLKAAEPKDC